MIKFRDHIEQAATDDPLFIAQAVADMCESLEFVANLAHERDGSDRAYRALEQFKQTIGWTKK